MDRVISSFSMRVVLKPGTERNGTNETVVFRRRDEGRSYFCLHVALHKRYRNVYVAAKVSTYSTAVPGFSTTLSMQACHHCLVEEIV